MNFPFIGMFAFVVRWGYRQKHRAQILFRLPMTDEDGHPIPSMDAFRKRLLEMAGKQYGDNHETFGLISVGEDHTPTGIVYVTFSDAQCHVHLAAPDLAGGDPQGNPNSLALLRLLLDKEQ